MACSDRPRDKREAQPKDSAPVSSNLTAPTCRNHRLLPSHLPGCLGHLLLATARNAPNFLTISPVPHLVIIQISRTLQKGDLTSPSTDIALVLCSVLIPPQLGTSVHALQQSTQIVILGYKVTEAALPIPTVTCIDPNSQYHQHGGLKSGCVLRKVFGQSWNIP